MRIRSQRSSSDHRDTEAGEIALGVVAWKSKRGKIVTIRIDKLVIGLVVWALLAVTANAWQIHVAVDGNDENAGTEAAPLATPAAAQQRLRESGKLGKEPCEVVLHAGVYRLTSPLRFGPQDSGSEGCPVVWRAAGDGEVVISGAELLSPKWEPYKDGIVRTKVPGTTPIDQLFVNGTRQIMARYPNLGAGFVPASNDPSVQGKRAGTVPYGGCSPNAWDKEKAREWADPTGAFMHGMHSGLWGSQHYRVLGKNPDGSLRYEGGWQNNRHSSPHRGYRMIENVFEELDAPGEWYHDAKNGVLYYMPAEAVDLATARVEAVRQIRHLVEVYGEVKHPVAEMRIEGPGNGLEVMTVRTYETTKPVSHLQFVGIRFAGTARTFMETKEPLLRSDWTIYRGGAVHLRGAEDIVIRDCRFEELGGNAVFVDGYNRRVTISACRFRDNGASDVNFVGSFAAVRNPAFRYSQPSAPLDEIDTTPGPKTEEYPADCVVEECLMTRCGRFEKQVAGVNLAMASRITIRHNTISHTPRAAINVCTGTWGGHVIEWNDCFETVLETHDHGAFNSWGRDRIWHRAHLSGPVERDKNGKPLISYYIEKYPDSPLWDPCEPIIIRNNRMQCDHGWDIDLDDGSTNYKIYNNLCLRGGLKTREGYYRVVTNNVILGGFTCNVPYPKPTHDVFAHNIVWGPKAYYSSNPALWGGSRDYTFVHNPDATETVPATALQQETWDDAHSLYGNAKFLDPEHGNFRVADDSPALKVGFKNFPMTGFGVTVPSLKAEAGSPPIRLPETAASNEYRPAPKVSILGAKAKTLETEAEVTATGMHDRMGTYLIEVPDDCPLAAFGFQTGDVVWMIDGKPTFVVRDFVSIVGGLRSGKHTARVWRDQEWKTLQFTK
ncbi:MAG: hypothetical protein D6741_15255 [Planctomycetota bacterium]|nr:MAG: hypothetical protein D6741_15255 [Planctomycetota bacterium]